MMKRVPAGSLYTFIYAYGQGTYRTYQPAKEHMSERQTYLGIKNKNKPLNSKI